MQSLHSISLEEMKTEPPVRHDTADVLMSDFCGKSIFEVYFRALGDKTFKNAPFPQDFENLYPSIVPSRQVQNDLKELS